MAHIDLKQRAVQAKLVYYGPGLCGKTTNLEYINRKLANDQELMSLATEGDRTIFFDFMPLELGQLRGLDVRVKLYTVPGQVRYNETRKMVLKNVDGLVFVADSQEQMMDANLESFDNMFGNLAELGIRADDLAIILQYNKRDLPGVLAPEVLDAALNRAGYPRFLASARTGEGVPETLKEACRQMLRRLMSSLPEREDQKNLAAREADRVDAIGTSRGRRPSREQPAAKSQTPAGGMTAVASRRRASGEQPAFGEDRQTLVGVPEPAQLPAKRPRSAVGEQRRLPDLQRPAPPPPPPVVAEAERPPSSPPEAEVAVARATPPAVAATPPAAAPAELGKFDELQASVGRIVEQVTVTERSFKEQLEALRTTLEGAWKTEVVGQLLERLPGKTELHQMGLTLQQLVDQTVGVDLSTLQAQLLHLSAVREDMKALRKSVAEIAEKTAAVPGAGAPAADLAGLAAQVAALPGKAELDRIRESLVDVRAELGRPSQVEPGVPALLRQLPAELGKLREELALLPTRAELAALAEQAATMPARAEPGASSEKLPAELIEKVVGAVRAELANLPTRAELGALREELERLPTKAELAQVAQRVASLPDRSELVTLRAELANLPTKAELAKVVQKLAALPPAGHPPAPKAPVQPVERAPEEAEAAPKREVSVPPEAVKVEAPPKREVSAPPEAAKAEAPPAPKVSAPPEAVKVEAPPKREVSAPPEAAQAEAPRAPKVSAPPEAAQAEAPRAPKVSAPPETPKAEAPPEPEPKPEAPAEPAVADAPPAPEVSVPPEPPKAEAPPEAAGEAEAPKAEPEPDAFKDDPAHQNAARVARVMVSDLWLYLKDQVEEGIRQGDFYERLGEALADMRATYDSRVPQQVRDQKDHLGPTIEEFLNRKRRQLGLE